MWEGVGICSYLLVNFWYTRIAANQSSISALLTNRVGDCFLTIGMLAMLVGFGNIDYSTVFSLAPFISENIVTLIGICLLIGAMAKSSQVVSVKALKFSWFLISDFFWILIYAGKVSNTLEAVDPLNENDPDNLQRQGINQQDIKKLTNTSPNPHEDLSFNKDFLKWFIGFSEGDGSFVITGGKSIFNIHLHLSALL